MVERSQNARAIGQANEWLLDIALSRINVVRASLYRIRVVGRESRLGSEVDDTPKSQYANLDQHIAAAVRDLHKSGQLGYLPIGLVIWAWLRFLQEDVKGCRACLDEAWEIAQPGPCGFIWPTSCSHARAFSVIATL